MAKKIFITGITGFAGSYLAELLSKSPDNKIAGTYISDESLKNTESINQKLSLLRINLLEQKKVAEVIASIQPDLIFHLAALTSPSQSFKNPSETITNNITAEVNLLEAVKDAKLENTRILIVSSGDIYGFVGEKDLPINEETALRPGSPYAVSKIAQDYLGLQYFLSHNLKIVRVRPFNHIGPRQSANFVVSSFAKKIAEIEKGYQSLMLVGNLNSERDFTDVKDTVMGYSLIIEKGKAGEVYNLGSGIPYKISDILDKLISLSSKKIEVKVDESLFRPGDTPKLVADNRKFFQACGWKPGIPIETTLKETLDYWRNIV